MIRKATRRVLWTLAGLGLAFFLVRAFWMDVYHVDTSSMEPTILGSSEGGEYVLVVYDDSPPERFELVVILREGESIPVVKRVVGLPEEEIQIDRGDLLVDGVRLPPSEPRAALIPIFDQGLHEVSEAFFVGGGSESPWTRERTQGGSQENTQENTQENAGEDDTWLLDAREIPLGAQAGLMFLHKGIHDGYVDHEGSIVFGQGEVNDAALGCEFRFREPGGRMRLRLLEQGDIFQVALAPTTEGSAAVVLSRRFSSVSEQELARTSVPFEIDSWYTLRFSNLDNHLSVELAGRPVLQASYETNRFHPSDLQHQGKSPVRRASLGGEGALLAFRGIRVWRDIHYTERGEFGNGRSVRLGPDEIFVLGDNSPESRDSRDFGPVGLEKIIGRPLWVVWPRWRSLRQDR